MSGLLLLRRRLPATTRLRRPLQVCPYGILGKPATGPNEFRLDELPKTPARTRFAPSPTGYLHLGSIRTALYNYLLARATGGQFIIRLEDTDRTRFVEDSEEKLYDDLRWAGMDWDEGPDKGGKFGPYKQSERLGLYREHAELLLNNGRAFRCFCPKPDNAPTTGSEASWASGYPGTCQRIPKSESDRRAANGEPHVIRYNSAKKHVDYVDIVYGRRRVESPGGDPIIIKSDGFPTYHFANVVDDHHMEITHVIRGAEWLISTPLHVELYRALEWKPPSFGHVGLLVDQQRQKLSKRDRENIGVSVFRSNAILPQALMNFAVLLGWNPQLNKAAHLNKNGLMSMEEMKNNFSLKFTRGDIVVDLIKLKYFQARWTRDLVNGSIQDESLLADHFVKPIASIVKRVDAVLQQHTNFERTRKRNEKPPEVPEAEALFLQDLGIKVENHSSLTYGNEVCVEDYVVKILRAAKGIVQSPEQFVRDCKYAFFPPSAKAIMESAGMIKQEMRGDMRGDVRLRYHKVPFGAWKTPNSRARRAAMAERVHHGRVLRAFLYALADIDQEMACKHGQSQLDQSSMATFINTRLSRIANAIIVSLPTQDRDETAPWRYLKWIFLCAESSAEHISISMLIAALGLERSHRIVRRAVKVGDQIHKLCARELRKERLLGKSIASQIRGEDQDPMSRMLRAAHQKGIFMSSPPPPEAAAVGDLDNNEQSTGQSRPADMDKSPRFLSKSEFKEGSRHLPPHRAMQEGPAPSENSPTPLEGRAGNNIQSQERTSSVGLDQLRQSVPKSPRDAVQESATFNGNMPIGLIPKTLGEGRTHAEARNSSKGYFFPSNAQPRHHQLRNVYEMRYRRGSGDVRPLGVRTPGNTNKWFSTISIHR